MEQQTPLTDRKEQLAGRARRLVAAGRRSRMLKQNGQIR